MISQVLVQAATEKRSFLDIPAKCLLASVCLVASCNQVLTTSKKPPASPSPPPKTYAQFCL